MNIGFTLCFILFVMFGIMTLIFTLLGEKAAMLISGFNTMPANQREQYDKAGMSRDHRNAMLLWTLIMAAGAAASWLFTKYAAVFAVFIWIIVFFKDVHIDQEKAFGKYKIK